MIFRTSLAIALGVILSFSPSQLKSQDIPALEAEAHGLLEEAISELSTGQRLTLVEEVLLTFYSGLPTPLAYDGRAINIPPEFLSRAFHRAHFQALTAVGYDHVAQYAVNDLQILPFLIAEAAKMTDAEKQQLLQNCNKGIWGSGVPAQEDEFSRCLVDRHFGQVINASIQNCRDRAHRMSFEDYAAVWQQACDQEPFGYLVHFAARETMRSRMHLALKFVIFHELGHLVLQHDSTTSDNEFAADKFAFVAMRSAGYGLSETIQAAFSAMDTYQDVWDHALATLGGAFEQSHTREDDLDPSINLTDLAEALDPVYAISSCRALKLLINVGVVSEDGRTDSSKIVSPEVLEDEALVGRFVWEEWFRDETTIRVMSVGQMVFQNRDTVCR